MPKDKKSKQKDKPAHEILSHLFKTIIDEAEQNPRFAENMLSALPEELTAKEGTKSATKKPAAKKVTFDPSPYNPLVLLRERGEDLMRIELKKRNSAELKQIIKHFKLKLTPHLKTKSPTKADLINALITFAKSYDKNRKGAAR